MSLFSSIRMASNALRADQIAMQVIGQNIANANTAGYIREDVILTPAPTQRVGGLLLGMGVEASAVVQKLDRFLEDRLRRSVSDRASSETQEEACVELEGLIGELSDADLSTSLNNFFSGIAEILNQPESISNRHRAVSLGVTLASDINRLAQRVATIRAELNGRVQDIAEQINMLTEQIQTLNIRIAETEGGDISASDAVGLRDQRLTALETLAELIDIRVKEQESGGVAVYVGGDFLVFEGTRRPVEVVLDTDRGQTVAGIQLAETGSPLATTAGQLHGLVTARDDILGGFLDRLDEFAGTLAFEFNKVFCSGQGLNGFEELSSESPVDANNLPLDAAGLNFTPVNGSFQVLVHNTTTDSWQTTDVVVDLNGLGDDMTLDDLAAALDAIDGLSAATTPTGTLTVASDSPDQQFAFSNDTSGILAALGLNTFFTGSTALGLGVNEVVVEDPAKFAASRNGIGVDTEIAVELAAFLDQPLDSQNGASLSVLYDRLISETTRESTVVQAVAEGARTFEQTLRGQKSAVSGVSLDEEAIDLIAHQHSFHASARYIATLQELLRILVAL